MYPKLKMLKPFRIIGIQKCPILYRGSWNHQILTIGICGPQLKNLLEVFCPGALVCGSEVIKFLALRKVLEGYPKVIQNFPF